MVEIHCTVNGLTVNRSVPERMLAADFLRDHLRLTGTHLGCEHGVCGACTVLLDGQPARSCLLFAAQIDGSTVTTVEGLDQYAPHIGPELRSAFHRNHALQCGYCTPGFLVASAELIHRLRGAYLTEEIVRRELAGNICRCTGYVNIVAAVLDAAKSAAAASRPTPA